jgi:hypothetical protein
MDLLRQVFVRVAVVGTLRGMLLAMCMVAVVVACRDWITTTGPRITPTVVGVIAQADLRSPNFTDIVFDDGRSITIDGNKAKNFGGGYPLLVGGLLLVGEAPSGPWYDVLAPSSSGKKGCFGRGGWARQEGELLLFDDGLVLPLAPGFDPGPVFVHGRFDGIGEFCINSQGQAVSYR